MELSVEKKYQLLLEISHKVRDTLDLDEIMNHLLDTIQTVVKYDAAGIFVLNQDLVHARHEKPREIIAGIARRGFDPRPPERDAMLTLGKGIIGYVIESMQSMVIPDVRLDLRYIEGRHNTLSEIAVPILRKDRAIGALNLESDLLAAYDETDLEVLQFFADAAAISIEKAMLHKQQLEKEILERQLQTACEVQSHLFPGSPPNIPGYDIDGLCLPTEEIGGDYYDFIPLSNNCLGMAVADVSGHGIAPALVMTAFRALLRLQSRSRLNPASTANAINRVLPEFTANRHFVTMLYAVLNPKQGRLTFVTCGHPPLLLVHPDGSYELRTTRGLALGISKGFQYTAEEITVAPGDLVALYTDGVVEPYNAQGQDFGVERLAALLRQKSSLNTNQLIQRIIQMGKSFSGLNNFLDDFTLLVIRRNE